MHDRESYTPFWFVFETDSLAVRLTLMKLCAFALTGSFQKFLVDYSGDGCFVHGDTKAQWLSSVPLVRKHWCWGVDLLWDLSPGPHLSDFNSFKPSFLKRKVPRWKSLPPREAATSKAAGISSWHADKAQLMGTILFFFFLTLTKCVFCLTSMWFTLIAPPSLSVISSQPCQCSPCLANPIPTWMSVCFILWHTEFKQDHLCDHEFGASQCSLVGSAVGTQLKTMTVPLSDPFSTIANTASVRAHGGWETWSHVACLQNHLRVSLSCQHTHLFVSPSAQAM